MGDECPRDVGYSATHKRLLERNKYRNAYMDAADIYRADELFRKYRVPVKFKREWQSTDGRYRMVFCSIWKKDAKVFENAMEELPKRMMILGYDDYEECWRRTIQPVAHELP